VASPAVVSAQQAGPMVLTSQQSGEELSESYIGAAVLARSAEGLESVGKVSDLVLGDDDKIVGVVVDVGGFLGVGAKPVGLAWDGLTEERADGELLLKTSMSRQDFEEAPEYQTLEEQQVEIDREKMKQMDTAPPPGVPAIQ
jgi:hypothetical protein